MSKNRRKKKKNKRHTRTCLRKIFSYINFRLLAWKHLKLILPFLLRQDSTGIAPLCLCANYRIMLLVFSFTISQTAGENVSTAKKKEDRYI